MITTGQPNLDAIIAELEATCLGFIESNALKAGEIATLKAEVVELKKKVETLETDLALAEQLRKSGLELSPQQEQPEQNHQPKPDLSALPLSRPDPQPVPSQEEHQSDLPAQG